MYKLLKYKGLCAVYNWLSINKSKEVARKFLVNLNNEVFTTHELESFNMHVYLYAVLALALNWRSTNEGHIFWCQIYDELVAGKYLVVNWSQIKFIEISNVANNLP